MKRLYAIVAASILIFASEHAALAQQKSLKDQLVGTWTYAASMVKNNNGADRWGANAKGLAIFEANGRYSFMISRSDIPKFAANNVTKGTDQENKAAMSGTIAHFGTWSIDEAAKILETKIEASSFPNLNGERQKRIISSLTGDELKYLNPATAAGSIDEALWKRVK